MHHPVDKIDWKDNWIALINKILVSSNRRIYDTLWILHGFYDLIKSIQKNHSYNKHIKRIFYYAVEKLTCTFFWWQKTSIIGAVKK